MNTLVIADLHLDLWLEAGREPLSGLNAQEWSGIAALIVAGDLSNKPKVRWKHVIRHLAQYIDPNRVYIVPGNHDYYDHVLDGDERLAQIAASEGAHFAQKSVVIVGNTRFLCCTLWTDFELHGQPAQAQIQARADMNDYRYIRSAGAGFQKIRPAETAMLHHDHRAWLEAELAHPHAGGTVVVTHHAPHPDLIGLQRTDLDPAYGSNLTTIIERYKPDVWMFGHTHHLVECYEGQTLVRNVSLGYPTQVPQGTEGEILKRGLISTSDVPDKKDT